jgi:hypothetical protein
MGRAWLCDGCGQATAKDALVSVGHRDEVEYCGDCLARWRAVEADLHAKQVELATAYEAFRAARLAEAQQALQALPDA